MSGGIKLIRSCAFGVPKDELLIPSQISQGDAEGLVRIGKGEWLTDTTTPQIPKLKGVVESKGAK